MSALPDVADRLDGPCREAAARISARALEVRRGGWDAAADASAGRAFAFIVVSGAVLRRVSSGGREGAELLGPGDVLQPGREAVDEVAWRAMAPTTVAVVDGPALAAAAAIPELAGGLLGAANARTQAVARRLVIAQWPSLDQRLVATLHSLAEQWGVVTTDGVVLPAFLTHSVLAPLVGARRPSVTTALQRLQVTGAVSRRDDGRWTLGAAA